MKRYYCHQPEWGTKPCGPFGVAELHELASNGVISLQTLAIPEGGSQWQALEHWTELPLADMFPCTSETLQLGEAVYDRVNPELETEPDSNDAFALLALNQAAAPKPDDELIITEDDVKRNCWYYPSRRLKDYLAVMALWFTFVILALVFLPNNIVMLIFLLAGTLIMTIGFTFIYFFVIDRY